MAITFDYFVSNDDNLMIINDQERWHLYYCGKSILTGDNLAYCKRQAKPFTSVNRLQWKKDNECGVIRLRAFWGW